MRIRAALLLLVALAVSVLTQAGPAQAVRQERITIDPDEEVIREFPPVPGNNPANEAHNPDTCEAAPYCDVIPITVVPPAGLPEDAEFFVKFELAWESPELQDPSNGEIIASNDMDMYIYDDPIRPEAGEDANGVIASGATQTQPEVARLFKPSGDYAVVVVNFVGANTGYVLTATYTTSSFEAPLEFQGPPQRERPARATSPSATGGQAPSPAALTSPGPSPSSGLTRSAVPSIAGAPGATGLAPSVAPGPLVAGSAEQDPELGGFGDDGSFETSLGALPSRRPVATQPISAPGDPSAMAIVLSLAGAPLAASGAGATWFYKRRSGGRAT